MKKKLLNKRRKRQESGGISPAGASLRETVSPGASVNAEDDETLIEYCIEMNSLLGEVPMTRERARELLKMGRESAQMRQRSLGDSKNSGKVPAD